MDQTRREFLIAIEDLVEQILDGLDELREKQEDSRLRRALLEGIFRHVHSVKGSAASIGLDGLSEIAHVFESLLEAVRAGRVRLDDVVLDTFEAAAGALSKGVALSATGTVEPSPRRLLARIRALAQDNTSPESADTKTRPNVLPLDLWQALSQEEKRHAIEAMEEGADLFVIVSTFDITDFDEQFYGLKEMLAAQGEVISTLPTVAAGRPDKINFRILYTSHSAVKDIETAAASFAGSAVDKLSNATPFAALSVDEETGLAAPDSKTLEKSSLSNSIRIDLDELDRLISATHELFRTTTAALELARANCLDAEAQKGLETVADQIRQSFMAVEDKIINLRMVSVDRIFKRALRAGRAAARLGQKAIDFEILGMDLPLDKLLCDALSDPLLHLVRNAVDHGIETSDERLQAGKQARGRVRIEAVREGSRTRLRITDDGRGIDPELVSQAGMKLGIIDKGVTLDMEQSLRLIFRSGFSTVSSVSSVSGRGVGLDVVETTIERVGGEVRVSSELGRGSSFQIRLPASFGLLRSTVITSAGHCYCIDAGQVLNIATVNADEIQQRERELVLGSENHALPLLRLRELLGQPSQAPDHDGRLKIVTCQLSDEHAEGKLGTRIALVVDGIEGSQDVLVRNLGRHAGRWHGIAGATELKQGAVALVLDLSRLLDGAHLSL